MLLLCKFTLIKSELKAFRAFKSLNCEPVISLQYKEIQINIHSNIFHKKKLTNDWITDITNIGNSIGDNLFYS